MIRLGLCSGACITRDIKAVIALAAAAGLDAVEWAADVHVGAGDFLAAEKAMMGTLMAGLSTASYATLYRAGSEEGSYPRFDTLLEVAAAMQAPIMRMFALGGPAPSSAAEKTLESLASVLRQLGDRAARKGITLCLSMSRGTYFDGYDRALRLAGLVDHDFIRLAWEDLPGSPPRRATAALEGAGRYASLAIARCADRDGSPVALAEADWRARVRAFKRAEIDPKMSSFVLLGAARPEGEEGELSLAADARTLRSLISEAG
jgi:hypothetical protein